MAGRMKNKIQTSESFRIGALLAVIGGFLDAYTYLCRGQVFANAQTGNIVLLGIKAAEGDFSGALYYLIPIFAFVLGVAVSELVRGKMKNHKKIHWRQWILLMELAVLLGVAFIPQGGWDLVSTVLVAFVCSIQVQSFRKLHGKVFATTMCTGNLRSASENFYAYWMLGDKKKLFNSFQYLGIIFFFILGAAAGTLATIRWSIKAVLFCCLGLAVVFWIMREEEI